MLSTGWNLEDALRVHEEETWEEAWNKAREETWEEAWRNGGGTQDRAKRG